MELIPHPTDTNLVTNSTLPSIRACHSSEATAIKDLFFEMKERQKWCNNILIYEVSEQTDDNEDVKLATNIL